MRVYGYLDVLALTYPRPGIQVHPSCTEASEEHWKCRQERRQAGVTFVKRSSAYRKFVVKRRCGELSSAAAPRTPDPTEQTLSKRTWESTMKQWRWDLSSYELDEPIEGQ